MKRAGRRLSAWLTSESVVISVILLNTLSLTALGFTSDQGSWERVWLAVDYVCVIFFVLEAALKIGTRGMAAYWGDGWNRLDFVVTSLSLPALLAPLMPLPRFSVILTLRLGRLLRLLRLLRFIPNREHLATGIKRALKASVGVLATLFLVNLILALGATFLFGEWAPEHFGDPARSVYSLFRVFTVEGWYEIPDLIAERADSPLWALTARGYFVLAVLVGGILGLSLANAVFVDEMMMDNNRDLEARVEVLTQEVRALRLALTPSLGTPPPPAAPPESPGVNGDHPGS